MKKVITYGTYDLLHFGHIRLLERAKALGDYLIVGVTADDFDKARGKINTKQNVIERIEAVRNTGLADEIIIEEYAGQKIDDIKKYNIDIFAIGSDWQGKFDYLKEYCQVIYLDRTIGISSTELRSDDDIRMGFVGDNNVLNKFYNEAQFINGIKRVGVYATNKKFLMNKLNDANFYDDFDALLNDCDALYVLGTAKEHYEMVKKCLKLNKHVLVEAPITTDIDEYNELVNLAESNKVILMDSIKTAYATAYHRLLLLIKGGIIGKVVSVDVTCTSMTQTSDKKISNESWTSILKWGPVAMLPVFDILGTKYIEKKIVTSYFEKNIKSDMYSNIIFEYPNATANIKVGKGIKSESSLIISGTKGCIVVGSPWWKTDYFEIHYENINDNKKFFYQLDGEGIRNELLQFVNNIKNDNIITYIDSNVSKSIIKVIQDYLNDIDVKEILI